MRQTKADLESKVNGQATDLHVLSLYAKAIETGLDPQVFFALEGETGGDIRGRLFRGVGRMGANVLAILTPGNSVEIILLEDFLSAQRRRMEIGAHDAFTDLAEKLSAA